MINWTFKQQSGEWGCRMKKKYTRKGQRHSIPEYPHNLIVFKSLSWNPFFNLAKSLICPCTTMHGCYNFIRALFHLYLNYFLKNAKLSERERTRKIYGLDRLTAYSHLSCNYFQLYIFLSCNYLRQLQLLGREIKMHGAVLRRKILKFIADNLWVAKCSAKRDVDDVI